MSRCYGRQGGFHSTGKFWKIRGGEASFPDHRDPNLPPDLPDFGDDDGTQKEYDRQQQMQRGTQDQYHYNAPQQQYVGGEQGADPRYSHQSQYYSQQNDLYGHHQQHQPPPNRPPGPYGVDHGHGPPPLPPSHGQQQQYPSLPGDHSLYQEDDEPEMDMNSAFGGGDNIADGNSGDRTDGMDLSSFDKEYILKGLAKLYKKKILPLETSSRYGHFHSPPLSPADFVAPPQVLMLGQYR